jgi:WD40 repeat protein
VSPKCCAFDNSSKYLAVGNSNGTLDLYDFKSQSFKKRSWKLEGSINCLSWSKNDRYVATGNKNGSIIIFNNNLNQCNKPSLRPDLEKSGVSSLVTSLQYSTKQPTNLGVSYDDGTVFLWDTAKALPSCSFRAHSSPCMSLVLSPVSAMLMVSGGLDRNIVLYDIDAKK